MKVGDFVEVKPKAFMPRMQGLITDSIEDIDGFWMYEVTSLDPPERGWFADLQLRIINEEKH